MRWVWHVARIGETRNAQRILVGKPERKKPLGRPLGVDGKVILECVLRKKGKNVDWMHLAQDRDRWRVLVDTVRNLRVH
jgi:hypothetical protein